MAGQTVIRDGVKWDPNLPSVKFTHSPHNGNPEKVRAVGLEYGINFTEEASQINVIKACLECHVVVLLTGRGWGKTALWPMLAYEEGRLTKGPYNLIYGSPNFDLAKEQYEAGVKIFESLELVGQKNAQHLWFDLKPFGNNKGGRFYFWGLDQPEGRRGRRANRIILDECKDIPKQALEVIRWMGLGRGGGKKLYIGTPKRNGIGAKWFRDMYYRARAEEGWRAFNAPSDCNPHLTEEEMAEIMNECDSDEEVYEERLGQFLEDENAVFSNLDKVFTVPVIRTFKVGITGGVVFFDECDSVNRPNLWIGEKPDKGTEHEIGVQYIQGADFGEVHDPTVCRGFNHKTRKEAWVLRLTRVPYPEQIPVIDAVMRKFGSDRSSETMLVKGVERVVKPRDVRTLYDGSSHGKEVQRWLAIRYGDYAQGINWSHRVKLEDIARGKSLCSAAGKGEWAGPRWHFLDIDWVRAEWEAFEVVTHTKQGIRLETSKYGAPAGMHDDSVTSALLLSRGLAEPYIPHSRPQADPDFLSGSWLHEMVKNQKKNEVLRSQTRG